MIQKVNAGSFISELFSAKERPRLRLIFSDNRLIRRLIEDRLRKISGQNPVLFSGKSPIQEAVESLSTGDLFGTPPPVWIELPEKISSKQWSDFSNQLSCLSEPARQELYILASASARHGAPDPKILPWTAEQLVIYEPARNEALSILTTLMKRYGSPFADTNATELNQWCQWAYDDYGGDLEACDLHFERMVKGSLSFQAAFVPKTDLDAFDFIEALSTGDRRLVLLRMNQLEQAGEEASSVLSALAFTGRQVLAFQAALNQTGQAKTAHELVKIPYPSQARVERLAKRVTAEKWAQFFLAAAELERSCRLNRNAHSWLAIELTCLLN
jgi:DNA polymerase III delta subunit